MNIRTLTLWLKNFVSIDLLKKRNYQTWLNNGVYLLQQKVKPFSAHLMYYPVYIHIDVTSRCNLSCPHCISLNMPPQLKKDMSMDTFHRITPIFQYTKEVSLFGCAGEPLLNPNFFQMIEIIKKYKTRLLFSTNGMLWSDATIKKVVESKVDAVTFSIDGTSQEMLSKMRPGANLEKIITTIKQIVEYKMKRKTDYPQIYICYTISRDNILDAPQMVELAYKLRVKKIFFQNIMPHTEIAYKKSVFALPPDFVKGIYEQIKKMKSRFNLELRLPEEIRFYLTFKRKVCLYPWEYMQIRSDGEVYPCCFFSFPSREYQKIKNGKLENEVWEVNIEPLGNVNTENILKIWNNVKYRTFRKNIILGKLCSKNCIFPYNII